MTETKLTVEMLGSEMKYYPERGLERFPIDDLERLARELESHQQFPYIVAAIYKETHARRWLLNRNEEKNKGPK